MFTKSIHQHWGFMVLALAAFISIGKHLIQPPGEQYQQMRQTHDHLQRRPPFIERWRQGFVATIQPVDPYGLFRALFLGDTKALNPSLQRWFRKGGLSHLVAASGFNCWIVAQSLLQFWRALRWVALKTPILPRLPPANVRGYLERAGFFTGMEWGIPILGAWLFWLWSDGSPSITRAATWVTLSSMIKSFSGHATFLRLIAAQILLFLAFAPEFLYSPSFWLSFSCLVGLVSGQKMGQWLWSRTKAHFTASPILKFFIHYVGTSLGVLLATAPVTWIFFHEWNGNSLWTNPIAIYPVTFVFMPVLLIFMMACCPLWYQYFQPWMIPESLVLGILHQFGLAYVSLIHWTVDHGPDLYYAPWRDFS